MFANESFFTKANPMERKSLAGKALHQFNNDFRVPKQLTFDGSAEQVKPKTEFMKHIQDYGIDYPITEPHRPHKTEQKWSYMRLRSDGSDKWSSVKSQNNCGIMV